MSKLSPRASNGFYQSLGNKTSPCSTGENEVISDCQGVETKPCLFPSSFFYLQSKSFMTLEKENNRSSCPETPGRDPPFWGRSRSETKPTLGRDRNPPGPSVQFSSLSHVQLFATPWTAASQASLSITNSQSPPKSISIELVMPSSHLILCHPLLLPSSIPPNIRVFQMSQLFPSGGQSIGASASTSVLPMNTQD